MRENIARSRNSSNNKMESLYTEAACVIEQAKKKRGTLKGLCLASDYRNKKKLYALVCQTVKYKNTILKILAKLQDDESTCRIDENLQLVLTYDILFGKGVRCSGRFGVFSKENKKRLFELLGELQSSGSNVDDGIDTSVISLPRYVRVNTLKITVDEAVKRFAEDGWKFIENHGNELNIDEFTIDVHIPEVLVFYPGTDLHQHTLYTNGSIVLQDKASCLPAFLLKPKSKSTVIDACAAPGNKTTHLSAIMKNKGRILAFDLDEKRLRLLKQQTQKVACENVKAIHQDFLKIKTTDDKFTNVKYILLDPSCSGSGMVSRMDKLLSDQNENVEKLRLRLESLSKFQYAMLCHALSFPNVEKVAYSTCSVHQQENEVVVERALQRFCDKFSLIQLMPSWEHRGMDSFNCGSFCLRASPDIDRTNGFFVAIFKRVKSQSVDIETKATEDNLDFKQANVNKEAKKRKRCKRTGIVTGDIKCKARRLDMLNSKRKRRKRQLKMPVTFS